MYSSKINTISHSGSKVSPMAVDDDKPASTEREQSQTGEKTSSTGLMDVVSDRLADTAAHGIPNISRAKSKFRRITWMVLFLGGFGMFIYMGCTLVIKYYSWPINVNMEVRSLKKVYFPAVTWCNLNPISTKAAMSNPLLNRILGDNSPLAQEMSKGYEEPTNYTKKPANVHAKEMAQEIIGSLPYEDRRNTGHDIRNMLFKCRFSDEPCWINNFTSFYNYRYGNCYTFNSGHLGQPTEVTHTGQNSGLSMEIYIEQDQYISNIETGAGIRIMVHNQTDMPFPEDQGANVAPGSETFIGMYRVIIQRLPEPYGSCENSLPDDNVFKKKFKGLNYTKKACDKDCYFQAVLDKCNCSAIQYRYNDSIPACDSSVKAIDNCVKLIKDEYLEGTLECDCPFSCDQTRYELSYSSSAWPNVGHKPSVKKGIEKLNRDTQKKNENNTRFVEENMLRVNIYYDDLNYDNIYQTAAYSRETLASDLGGQVGLWIGVSVLTIFEFVELMYDVIIFMFAKRR